MPVHTTIDVITNVLKQARKHKCEAEVVYDALRDMKKRPYISVTEAILLPTKRWVKIKKEDKR